MAHNSLTCDREQSLLLAPDLRDWLPEDHLAWFVVEAIDGHQSGINSCSPAVAFGFESR
jgi:hypothetical protein